MTPRAQTLVNAAKVYLQRPDIPASRIALDILAEELFNDVPREQQLRAIELAIKKASEA